MNLRELLNKLETIEQQSISEALTLKDVERAVQGHADATERGTILATLAQQNGLPGLYDPVDGNYVFAGLASDAPNARSGPRIASTAPENQNEILADKGLIDPRDVTKAHLSSYGGALGTGSIWNSRAENDKLQQGLRDRSGKVIAGQERKAKQLEEVKQLLDLINQYVALKKKKQQPTAVQKEAIFRATELIESFGYQADESWDTAKTIAIRSWAEAKAILHKTALPVFAALEINEGIKQTIALKKTVKSEEAFTRAKTQLWMELCIKFGVGWVAMDVGAKLGASAGTAIGAWMSSAVPHPVVKGAVIGTSALGGGLIGGVTGYELAKHYGDERMEDFVAWLLHFIWTNDVVGESVINESLSTKTLDAAQRASVNNKVIGTRNPEVVKLQTALQQAGLNVGRYGVDGRFGPDTVAAVKQYKQKIGVRTDIEAIVKLLGLTQPTTESITLSESSSIQSIISKLNAVNEQAAKEVEVGVQELEKAGLLDRVPFLKGIFGKFGRAEAEAVLQLGSKPVIKKYPGEWEYNPEIGKYVNKDTGQMISGTKAKEAGGIPNAEWVKQEEDLVKQAKETAKTEKAAAGPVKGDTVRLDFGQHGGGVVEFKYDGKDWFRTFDGAKMKKGTSVTAQLNKEAPKQNGRAKVEEPAAKEEPVKDKEQVKEPAKEKEKAPEEKAKADLGAEAAKTSPILAKWLPHPIISTLLVAAALFGYHFYKDDLQGPVATDDKTDTHQSGNPDDTQKERPANNQQDQNVSSDPELVALREKMQALIADLKTAEDEDVKRQFKDAMVYYNRDVLPDTVSKQDPTKQSGNPVSKVDTSTATKDELPAREPNYTEMGPDERRYWLEKYRNREQ